MNTVFYILIILGTNGKGAVGVANYDNMAACLNAKQQIESIRGGYPNYNVICTPSFIKEDKKK
jgi:hypothetical protein